jgi:hypothetical protein
MVEIYVGEDDDPTECPAVDEHPLIEDEEEVELPRRKSTLTILMLVTLLK